MICSTDPSKFESSKLLETVVSLLNLLINSQTGRGNARFSLWRAPAGNHGRCIHQTMHET